MHTKSVQGIAIRPMQVVSGEIGNCQSNAVSVYVGVDEDIGQEGVG